MAHSGGGGALKVATGLSLFETPLCPGWPPRWRPAATAAGPSATGSRPSSAASTMWPTTAPNLAAYLLLIDLADDGVSGLSMYWSRRSPSLTRATSSFLPMPARSSSSSPSPQAAAAGTLVFALSRARLYFRSTTSASFSSLYAACSAACSFFSRTTWASDLRRAADCAAYALHIATMPSIRSGTPSALRAISPASAMRLRAAPPPRRAARSQSSNTRPMKARSMSAASLASAILRASTPARYRTLIKIYLVHKS